MDTDAKKKPPAHPLPSAIKSVGLAVCPRYFIPLTVFSRCDARRIGHIVASINAFLHPFPEKTQGASSSRRTPLSCCFKALNFPLRRPQRLGTIYTAAGVEMVRPTQPQNSVPCEEPATTVMVYVLPPQDTVCS